MYTEFFSILIILLVASLGFLLLDLLVAGVLALGFRFAFWPCFRWGLLSLLVTPLLLCYGVLIERNCYRVNRVEVVSESLPEAFDGYRLVQISDIHARSFRLRPSSLGRSVDKVNALGADLIVFTGDLVTIDSSELENTGAALRRLHAPDGVLSILGNHDYGSYVDGRGGDILDSLVLRAIKECEPALGWDLLLNEHRKIVRGSDTLAVIGVENISTSQAFPTTGDFAKARSGAEGCWSILLSHDPTHWERDIVGKEDIPLTLSGHTHSAQFSLFGWTPSKLIYPHCRGLYKEQGQYLYVNIGLGETIFPARIGAVPEITLITLKKQ